MMKAQEQLIKGRTYTKECAGCGKLFEFTYVGKGPAIKRCFDCPVPSREGFKKAGDTIKSVCKHCGTKFEYSYAGTGPVKITCAECSIHITNGTEVYVRCTVCGVKFHYTHIGGTLITQCSRCKNSRYNKYTVAKRIEKRGWKQGDEHVATCVHCHADFSYPRKHKPRFCCDDCHKLRDTTIKQRRRSLVNRGSWNQGDWIDTLEAFSGVCAYCEHPFDNLEQEHFVPVIHGGKTELGNIVPACRTCNAHKSAKLPEDFCSRKTYNRITKILSSLRN